MQTLTSPCCSRGFVSLSVAFKQLNRVTDCYKSQCDHYDDLGGHHDVFSLNCRQLVIPMWRASKLLRS